MAVIFPYDRPVYVGTLGVDGVDVLLGENPYPFNPGDGGFRPTLGAPGGPDPLYPVAFINGTNAGQPDDWSPVYFIAYSATFRVEVHGRFTGVAEGDAVFQIPDVIKPDRFIPIHGTTVDQLNGWRGYIDSDGTVYYVKSTA